MKRKVKLKEGRKGEWEKESRKGKEKKERRKGENFKIKKIWNKGSEKEK